jgi:hypothetical protein
MFLPVIEDEDKVYTLRYRDTLDFNTPWKFWKTLGKPSDMMIKALRKDGMHLLEIVPEELE